MGTASELGGERGKNDRELNASVFTLPRRFVEIDHMMLHGHCREGVLSTKYYQLSNEKGMDCE